MKRIKIEQLLRAGSQADPIIIKGWVRTRRDAKGFSFIELNDGSCLANLQVVADEQLPNYEDIRKLTTGSAIAGSPAVPPTAAVPPCCNILKWNRCAK